MRYNKKCDFFKLKKYSLIRMASKYDSSPRDYILVSSSKRTSSLDVVCVKESDRADCFTLSSSAPTIPSLILSYPVSYIDYIELLPKEDLLFLIAHIDNPHIKAALEVVL
jgi:hypothetical protein